MSSVQYHLTNGLDQHQNTRYALPTAGRAYPGEAEKSGLPGLHAAGSRGNTCLTV